MLTRRSFIVAAGTVGIFVPFMRLSGQVPGDAGFVVFVSDTHIREKASDGKPDDPGAAAKLVACVRKILAKKPYPYAAVFCGDLTDNGLPGQMTRFREIIRPLKDAGIPCLLMAGNHDYYSGKHDELFAPEIAASPVPGKTTRLLETPFADIVCLDTPDMMTQDGWWGRIDGAQLEWLKAYMKSNGGKKPYFICAHHPLYLVPVPAGVGMFRPVTGWISGHRHLWHQQATVEHDVPVSYIPSTMQDPFGYVEMGPEDGGFAFRLVTEDERNLKNGQTVIVKGRTTK